MEYVPTVVAKATNNLQKAIDEVKISVDPNMTHQEKVQLEEE